jgi:hypothetical protein
MQTKMSGSPLMIKGLNMPTQASSAASGVAGIGADMLGQVLQDDDPTDKGSVGKSALSGAAKGAAAGLAFGPLGAAIGGGIGAIGGFIQGKKAQKEGLAANEELARQQAISNAVSENRKSMEEYNTGVDLAAQALSSPATMKKLTAVGMSYSPMKMKMKEAQMGGKMMEISGASTLPERY